uniref:hypothetical protein n=1 Tax=uncultured Acinetobacter sp. TaxID=165433 RepID=UPI002626DEF9|nr:hypothetical protein [uncultured Acinetobacter sp.]
MNQQIDMKFCTDLIEKCGGLKTAKELLANCPPNCWTVKISDCTDDVINFSTSGEIDIATLEIAVREVTKRKRRDFAKDLDKLIDGDYVLVPKNPTKEMERAAMEAGAGFLFEGIWAAALNASQEQV